MRFAWTLLAGAALLVTGCSVATTTSTQQKNLDTNTVPFSGMVHGGQQPINGAKVYLLAVNASSGGYGKASTSLLTGTGNSDSIGSYVLTNATGGFTIAADEFSCSGGQVYLYSLGGSAGFGDSDAIGLMAVLGQCTDSSFSGLPAMVQMNEVTTVAAAWALAGYATDATHMSGPTSTAAATGMANAALNAANLANIGTGLAYSTTPGGNGTVPRSKINTLADILASCINSATGATGCSTLFVAAENGSGAQPTDTATAAINIAHKPGANIAALYGLATPSAPFQPSLTSLPNDWLIGVTYNGGGLSSNCSGEPCSPGPLALDASGHVWVGNYFGEVTELSNTGAALSPVAGYTGGGSLEESYGLAVNSDGSVWVTDQQSASGVNGGDGAVTVLSAADPSSASPSVYSTGGIYFPEAIAADTNGDVWVANYGDGSATLFNSSGTAVLGSPFASGQMAGPTAVAIDANHNAWFPDQGAATPSATSVSPSGTVNTYDTGGSEPSGIATDAVNSGGSEGHVWVANYYSNTVSELQIGSGGAVTVTSTGYSGGGIDHPNNLAVDGAGNVWITNYRGNSISELEGASGTAGTAISPSTGYGADAPLSTPYALAIDPSGNVWVSNFGGNTVTQFVGAAAPVKTPLLGPPSLP